jgi:protein-S-isoprenylcysteine O-methyltransferase Ste14
MRLPPVALEAVFIGTVFVLAPIGMVELNEACGWPRWQSGIGRFIGGGLVLAGIALSVYCWNVFSRAGEGTPVPTDPPKHLVITGLYRYSRNPMYSAHAAILLGLFLYSGELSLLFYAGIYIGGIYTWIVLREEPELRKRFGAEYDRYRQRVPRWVAIWPRTTGG